MKKILVVLVLLLGVLGLAGCDGNKVDFEADILSAFSTLENSLNGTVVVTTTYGEETLRTELRYAFVREGDIVTIDELMYKQTDPEEMHVYVKDNVAYILEDGLKVKSTLSGAEEQAIINDYGFESFMGEIIAMYDAAFFAALTVTEVTEDVRGGKVAHLTLDLSAYTGDKINKENVTSFQIIASYSLENRLLSVENNILRGSVESSIVINFGTTEKPQIAFPTDLSSYLEAQYN